jgi:hypothetical protein
MLARNMVGVPVETEKYVKGALTDKILTNFRVQSTAPVLPDNVMVQNRSNPIETRIYFPEYDGYGNLLEQEKSADMRHDYIYAYAGTYPIAEIINGDSTSIARLRKRVIGRSAQAAGIPPSGLPVVAPIILQDLSPGPA